jgi:hypothetical protein
MTAVDDCGVRINPMIVEGQITGGLTEGFAKANMQWITFDEYGNCIGSNFLDYLVPTAWETPRFRLGETVTPSPTTRWGRKGSGESATVGSPAAYVNAVLDALRSAGSRHREHRHARAAPPGVGCDQRSRGRPVTADGRARPWPRIRHRGEPFALATVTWRQGPTSGKGGSKAIIRPDGSVTGWIGGACARPTVVARRWPRSPTAGPACCRSAPTTPCGRDRGADGVRQRRRDGGVRGTRPARSRSARGRVLADDRDPGDLGRRARLACPPAGRRLFRGPHGGVDGGGRHPGGLRRTGGGSGVAHARPLRGSGRLRQAGGRRGGVAAIPRCVRRGAGTAPLTRRTRPRDRWITTRSQWPYSPSWWH